MENECLLYCFGELIQKDLDRFKNFWNSHRIRRQMNSNSLSRTSGRPDILYFTPDFVNSWVRDYRSAISDDDNDDVLLLEAECCDANGQEICSNEPYELAGIICTENNISVAQNVTEALLVYERLLTLIREI